MDIYLTVVSSVGGAAILGVLILGAGLFRRRHDTTSDSDK